ncbi:MAG: YeeE/YedE thiosulfate transporter family protein [Hyphomicrobiaceae bacterium]
MDNPQLWLTVCGLLIGICFGALVAQTNFCAMGGVSDLVLLGDGRRMGAWLLAGATAVVGTQALAAAGHVTLANAIYVTQHLNWLGHIAGGLAFGIGMVLAGGCVSRNLVRAGRGDVRALVVLAVVSLSALSHSRAG